MIEAVDGGATGGRTSLGQFFETWFAPLSSTSRDAAAGRTLSRPQASDLCVRHGPKQIPAAQASTGEQKALLAGLVVAHTRLVATMSGLTPLVLLDEIAAHFDPVRRDALFEVLETLGGQIWLSGADRATFGTIEKRALMLNVTPGSVASWT